MTKPQKRTIGAIVILLMLGTSSISVAYSYGDEGDFISDKKGQSDSKSEKKQRLRAILTEKIVDGELQVRHYALPENTSDEDMRRLLSLEGHTSGWAYVNYKAYQAGIVLFDGKISRNGENLWEISSKGVLSIGEEQFELDLDGKSNGSRVLLHGTASNEDLSYRVVFSGKISETDVANVYFISLMNSGIKSAEMGQNIKFLQIGEIFIKSDESIGSNQEFRNSIW